MLAAGRVPNLSSISRRAGFTIAPKYSEALYECSAAALSKSPQTLVEMQTELASISKTSPWTSLPSTSKRPLRSLQSTTCSACTSSSPLALPQQPLRTYLQSQFVLQDFKCHSPYNEQSVPDKSTYVTAKHKETREQNRQD